MSDTHKYQVTAHAHIRLLEIVNNWPVRSRGGIRQIEGLGELLDLTPEERERIGWRVRQNTDGSVARITFQRDASIERELNDEQRLMLGRMVTAEPLPLEVPPWSRQNAYTYDLLVNALAPELDLVVGGNGRG